MAITYEESKAVQKPNGGWLAPRTDLVDNDGFFVALDSDKRISGCIQVFKNGTACYWREEGDQAKPAKDLEEAFANVFIFYAGTAQIASCPKCGSTEIKSESAFSNWFCAKCGTMVWSPPPRR